MNQIDQDHYGRGASKTSGNGQLNFTGGSCENHFEHSSLQRFMLSGSGAWKEHSGKGDLNKKDLFGNGRGLYLDEDLDEKLGRSFSEF